MAIAITVTRRWRHLRPVIARPRLLGRVALAAVLLTVNWTSYVYAVVNDRVLETALGYFIAPVGTMLVGAFVLHERLRRAQWWAIGFAVAAIVVLTASYGRVPYLALAIAVSWTAYGYLKKQVPLDPLDGMAAEVFLLVVPAVDRRRRRRRLVDEHPAHRLRRRPRPADAQRPGDDRAADDVRLRRPARPAHRARTDAVLACRRSTCCSAGCVYHEPLPPSRVVGFALVWVGLAILTVDSLRRARAHRLDAADRLALEMQSEPAI